MNAFEVTVAVTFAIQWIAILWVWSVVIVQGNTIRQLSALKEDLPIGLVVDEDAIAAHDAEMGSDRD